MERHLTSPECAHTRVRTFIYRISARFYLLLTQALRLLLNPPIRSILPDSADTTPSTPPNLLKTALPEPRHHTPDFSLLRKLWALRLTPQTWPISPLLPMPNSLPTLFGTSLLAVVLPLVLSCLTVAPKPGSASTSDPYYVIWGPNSFVRLSSNLIVELHGVRPFVVRQEFSRRSTLNQVYDELLS